MSKILILLALTIGSITFVEAKPQQIETCAASEWIAQDQGDTYFIMAMERAESVNEASFQIGRRVGIIQSTAHKHGYTSKQLALTLLLDCKKDGVLYI